MIRIAIIGMGNLGKACAELIRASQDLELVATFTRQTSLEIMDWADKIDVVLVCVGSQIDAPVVTPWLAKNFCTVDSYDNHREMAKYIESISREHQSNNNSPHSSFVIPHCSPKVNIVGVGWDPGLFSLMRIYLGAFTGTEAKTFWGPGVSLGHTNAVKSIAGVKDAIQWTIPVISENRHKRVCHVVADTAKHRFIENEIKTMPNYFAPYQTEVHFVDKIKKSHQHGGFVIAKGNGVNTKFALKLKSNPKFTAAVMLAYAKAAVKLRDEGKSGVFTVADIAPRYLADNPIALI